MRTLSNELLSVVAKSDPEKNTNWLPFWMHSMDASGIMESLVQNWIPNNVYNKLSGACGEKDVISVLKFCALAHDVGKITYSFQAKIASAVGNSPFSEFVDLPQKSDFPTPHALASEVILLKYGCPPGIASIAGAHHGKPATNTDLSKRVNDEDDTVKIDGFAEDFYGKKCKYENFFETLWGEWINFSLEYCGFDSIDELPNIPMTAQVLICGLLIMADWIASNTYYFPLIQNEFYGKFDDYPERVEKAWEKLKFPTPWESTANLGFCENDFKTRFGFLPNATQKEIIETVSSSNTPGIYILEAPMGLGKTEAALAISEILAARAGVGGLYFGMPNQATSNGIFTRLEKWAGSISENEGAVHSIRLAHAAAALNEDYQEILEGHSISNDESVGLIAHNRFSGKKQMLLSDFVIGTVDQLLMSALKQKHVMLRHIGLAGKVVVIDECHAYDAYMSKYLNMAVKWLGYYKVPVIILSATLPPKRRSELIKAYADKCKSDGEEWKNNLSYPLLTYTDNDIVKQKKLAFDNEEKQVSINEITYEKIIDTVNYPIKCGGCVGIIVNTVKKAQALAHELRSVFSDSEVILIHSQYIMDERAKRERSILDRVGKKSTAECRRGLIVIGTQVLEQSLDLDFDLMITELCPMDLLLQRIGRLHRHRRVRPNGLENAICYVLERENGEFDEGSKAIYGEWLLMKTNALIPNKLTFPKDIPLLVARTYDEEDTEMLGELNDDMRKALDEYKLRIGKKERSAENYLISQPKNYKNIPWMNTLDGWLDDSIKLGKISENCGGEMAVRDGDPSVDVIALKLCADNKVRLIVGDKNIEVPTDRPPSREESLIIARQKLRLPGYFSKNWNIKNVIDELETVTKKYFSEWQNTSLLKEELVLLFDEDNATCLVGTKLSYDSENGLTYEQEKNDGRKGI